MKRLSEMTKEDIAKAFESQMLNESTANDVVYVGGIPFKNVHMPLDEYAKSIGAIPYEESKISNL